MKKKTLLKSWSLKSIYEFEMFYAQKEIWAIIAKININDKKNYKSTREGEKIKIFSTIETF